MLLELLGLPFLVAISIVYGLCCIAGILFAFYIEKYEEVEEKLGSNLFYAPIVTTLDMHIGSFDSWARQHNKVTGVAFSLLSISVLVSIISKVIS